MILNNKKTVYAYYKYMKKIVLTGGGTAGHCIPCLALLPELKRNFDAIYYIGSEKGMEKKLVEKFLPYFSVDCVKLERNLSPKNLLIPFTLIKGITKARKILKKISPDVVFSKGGYVSLPTVFAAKSLKIPIISHESDLSIGLANKITAKYCEKVLTSFPETAKKLPNGEFVGSPIRKELFLIGKNEGLDFFGFSGRKPILLIIGGSSGAKAINFAVKSAKNDLIRNFDIIHVCGKSTELPRKSDSYKPFVFLNEISYAFAAADICVSRAGSNSAFELLAKEIPTLFIPLSTNASRGDQIENAEYFRQKGLADILYQSDLTGESLTKKVKNLYKERSFYLKNMSEQNFTSANEKIVRVLSNYSKKNQ